MVRLWDGLVAIGFVAELLAMGVILAGGPDRTFSAWAREHIPPWVLVAICGWFLVHTAGPEQDTRVAFLSTAAALIAARLMVALLEGR